MRLLFTSFIVFVTICVGPGATRSATLTSQANDPAVLRADQALQLALRQADQKVVAELLDEQFTSTDEAGQTWTAATFLRQLRASRASDEIAESHIKERTYGQLAIVTGSSSHRGDEVFVVRFWVKRSNGWRLLAEQGTQILTSAPQLAPRANSGPDPQDCENPCRSVPFTPKTAAQREVVRAYQAVETAVTNHDADTWAYHVADEFVGIGQRYTGKADTKEERVEQIRQRASGPVILPPMASLRVLVIGDAAIMFAEHRPTAGRPFRVTRAWVNRDGRWQLFHRQETTIDQQTRSTQ